MSRTCAPRFRQPSSTWSSTARVLRCVSSAKPMAIRMRSSLPAALRRTEAFAARSAASVRKPVSDIARLAEADLMLAVVPAQTFREVVRAARSFARAGVPWVICAKGIERASKRFLSDVLLEEIPEAIPAVLSGPSFATDVARGLPTAVTIAAHDEGIARQIAERLATPAFRLYRSTDIRGAEIGGAAKNVLAIACGIAKGAGLGASAGAALIARGFAELARFGRALDARPETLMGLSGLGDLVLTCSSGQSGNFS